MKKKELKSQLAQQEAVSKFWETAYWHAIERIEGAMRALDGVSAADDEHHDSEDDYESRHGRIERLNASARPSCQEHRKSQA